VYTILRVVGIKPQRKVGGQSLPPPQAVYNDLNSTEALHFRVLLFDRYATLVTVFGLCKTAREYICIVHLLQKERMYF
jgi:hypothetical protein